MTDQPAKFPTMLELARRYGLELKKILFQPKWRICCCPFHTEKTPSFHIDTATETFECLCCGARGNRIAFVARMEGLAFSDAILLLQALAQAAVSPPPSATPARMIQAHPPAERLHGVATDLRAVIDEVVIERDDLRELAFRIDRIARELEVKS